MDRFLEFMKNHRRLFLSITVLTVIFMIVVVRLIKSTPASSAADEAWSAVIDCPEIRVLPWKKAALSIRISPPPASEKVKQWQVTWKSTAGKLRTSGLTALWSCGEAGRYTVTAIVTSPTSGMRQTSLDLEVIESAYINPLTGKVEQPEIGQSQKEDDHEHIPFDIEEVTVEKEIVCRGEETLISIKAIHEAGQENLLEAFIGGKRGWDRAYSLPHDEPGTYKVPILLKDPNTEKAVRSYIYLQLDDCLPQWKMALTARHDPYRTEIFHFFTFVADAAEWDNYIHEDRGDGRGKRPEFQPQYFLWNFGDGIEEKTTETEAIHTFPTDEERLGTGAGKGYLVTVKAIGKDGKSFAQARTTIYMENPYTRIKHSANLLQLKTVFEPYPSRNENNYFIDIELRNLDNEEAAVITDVTLEYNYCDSSKESKKIPSAMAVSAIFPDSMVQPDTNLFGTFSMPASEVKDICSVGVELGGFSLPGNLPVIAFFHMDVPRSSQGTEDQTPLDPISREIMMKIGDLLGEPEIVKIEDVLALEDKKSIPRGTVELLKQLRIKSQADPDHQLKRPYLQVMKEWLGYIPEEYLPPPTPLPEKQTIEAPPPGANIDISPPLDDDFPPAPPDNEN